MSHISIEDAKEAIDEYQRKAKAQAKQEATRPPFVEPAPTKQESSPRVERVPEAHEAGKTGRKEKDWRKGVAVAGLGTISVFCVIWAWENVYHFFSFSQAWQWLVATTITGVLFVFPSVAKMVPRKPTKFLLWFSFSVAMVMSMISTLAVNYDNRQFLMASISQTVRSAEVATSQVNDDKVDIKRISDQQQKDSNELETLQNQQKAFEIGSFEYNRLEVKIKKLDQAIRSAEAEIKQLRSSQKKGEETSGVANAVTFYQWIANVFNWRADVIEFFIGIIPPLVIDVVGPFSAFLALRIRDES